MKALKTIQLNLKVRKLLNDNREFANYLYCNRGVSMKNPDMLWKIFTSVLGVIVVPLAGWVWSVNVEVAQLRNDMGDIESQVSDLEDQVEKQEEASRTLIKVESDLGHVREILSRIEDLVASN